MNLKGFFKECHEKEVSKMLSIYIVSSWVILQVLAVIAQPLGLPEKSVTYLIILLLIGFPVYVFYIWKFQLAKLEKQNLGIDAEGKKKKSAFQKMYFSFLGIIGIMAGLSVALIVNNNFVQNFNLPSLNSNDKIVVSNFKNNTGEKKRDILGEMTADWVIHGINKYRVAEVISSEVVNNYTSLTRSQASSIDRDQLLKKYFKPKLIISGEIFLRDSTLIFKCNIRDGDTGESLIALESIECDSEDSLKCIEALKSKIITFLTTKDQQELNLQEQPPIFEAYQKFLDARANFDDDEIYLALLNEAIELDPNYFEPEVHRVQHYYNLGDYKTSDSLLNAIKSNKLRVSVRQQFLLNYCEGLLEGDNRKIYMNYYNEYKIAPFHRETNSTMMIIALQYMNRPEEIQSIFDEASMEDVYLENCTYCGFRLYIMGLANIELEMYDQTITLLERVTLQNIEDLYLKKPLVSAYVRSGQISALNEYLSKYELTGDPNDVMRLKLFIGKQFLLINKDSIADSYFNKILELHKNEEEKINIVTDAYYYKKDYAAAESLLETLHGSDLNNNDFITKLAVSYHKNGKVSKAEQTIQKLEDIRTDYQFGAVDYDLAQYFAAVEDSENAMRYLEKAIASGHAYTPTKFQNDPHFKAYFKTEEFEKIMNFWNQ